MTASPLTRLRSAAAMAWLNGTFYPAVIIITLAFTAIGTVLAVGCFLVTWRQRPVLWLIRRMISFYGLTAIHCAWPLVRVRYVDLDAGSRPPFILTANHRAASDAWLMALLPCELVQVVNIWPFRIPILGVVAKIAGYLSVREMPIDRFLAVASQRLSEGVSIAVFPEGTRSGSGITGPFTSSAFRLALESEAPIVPIAISGNERVPPRGSLFLRPSVIHIHKLPAVIADTYRGLTPFQLKNLVRERIQAHLDEMEGKVQVRAGVA